MIDADFVKLVASMRAAQKRYFRDRSSDNLQIAKDLERAVDEALKRAQQKEHQANLFEP